MSRTLPVQDSEGKIREHTGNSRRVTPEDTLSGCQVLGAPTWAHKLKKSSLGSSSELPML